MSELNVEKKFTIDEIAAYHTETNTKLIRCCTATIRALEEIQQISDNPENLNRIRMLARHAIEYVESY